MVNAYPVVRASMHCRLYVCGDAVANYPTHLVRERLLADGRRVTIRPIRQADEEAERAFLAGLSSESLRSRFLKWVASPSEKLAHYFSDIDYERHMAFVCVARENDSEQIVGEARYIANADGTGCDFGVVVADHWRKSGVAGLLMEALIRTARSRGLRRMESTVLHENRPMLRFARSLGFEVRSLPGDLTTVEIVKAL